MILEKKIFFHTFLNYLNDDDRSGQLDKQDISFLKGVKSVIGSGNKFFEHVQRY